MENIFTESKPFLVFAKFLGFFTMSVTEDLKIISTTVKWFDVFMTCCSFVALVFLNVTTLLQANFLAVSESSFLLIAWDLTRKFELVSYIGLFLYQFQQRNQIKKFLEKLNGFDEKVKMQ